MVTASPENEEIGYWSILQGDMVKWVKKLPKKFALILTSPPYNAGIKYDLYDDKKPYDMYRARLLSWFYAMKQAVVPGGHIIINLPFSIPADEGIYQEPIAAEFASYLRQGSNSQDWPYVAKHVWLKGGRNKQSTAWGSKYDKPRAINSEEIFLVYRNGHTQRGVGARPDKEFVRLMTRPMEFNPGMANRDHPASFPTELAALLIRNYAAPGEWVLDPFCGTGATIIAAAEEGRNAVGIELSPGYCKKARKKLMAGNEKRDRYCYLMQTEIAMHEIGDVVKLRRRHLDVKATQK